MAESNAATQAPGAGPGRTVGNRAVSHSKWIVSAPIVAKLLGLAATVVLARLLAPTEFGLMAYAGSVLALFSLFQDLGVTPALIADPGDVTSRLRPAFFMSVGAGLVFYAALAAAAIPLGRFFGEPSLAPILMAMGLVIVLQTLGQVHYALLVRAESYRALFLTTTLQAACYLAVTIVLAQRGLGVWALVLGHLCAQSTRTTMLWVFSGWRPVSFGGHARLVSVALLRFGGVLTLVNVIDWAAEGWVLFTIGKLLGSRSLGLYTVCYEASRMAYFGLPALASSVVLTSYSSLLSDPAELRRLVLKGLRVVHGLAFPVAACIVALAPWIVPVVWGSKWDDAVPVLAVLGLLGFAAPLPNVLVPYFISAGKLRLLLRLSVLRLVAYAVVITFAARLGLRAVAWAHIALIGFYAGVVVALACRRLGCGLADLRAAVLWPGLRAAMCGSVAALVAHALDGALRPWQVIPPALAAGGLAYVAVVWLTDRAGFLEAASVLARGSGVVQHGR